MDDTANAARPFASVVTLAGEIDGVTPPLAVSATAFPETALPFASFSVTVTVPAVPSSASADVAGVNVLAVADTGPGTNVTVCEAFSVMPSVESRTVVAEGALASRSGTFSPVRGGATALRVREGRTTGGFREECATYVVGMDCSGRSHAASHLPQVAAVFASNPAASGLNAILNRPLRGAKPQVRWVHRFPSYEQGGGRTVVGVAVWLRRLEH